MMKNKLGLSLLTLVFASTATLNARYAPDGQVHYNGHMPAYRLGEAPPPPPAPPKPDSNTGWCPVPLTPWYCVGGK